MQNSGIPVSHAAVSFEDITRTTIGEMTYSQIFMKLRSDGSSNPKLRKSPCFLIMPARESDLFKQFGKKQLDNGVSANAHDPTIQAGADTYVVISDGINSESELSHHPPKARTREIIVIPRGVTFNDHDDDVVVFLDPLMKQYDYGGSADPHDPTIQVRAYKYAVSSDGINSESQVSHHPPKAGTREIIVTPCDIIAIYHDENGADFFDLIRPCKSSVKEELDYDASADKRATIIQVVVDTPTASSDGINSESKYKTLLLKLSGIKTQNSADNYDLHGFMAAGCAAAVAFLVAPEVTSSHNVICVAIALASYMILLSKESGTRFPALGAVLRQVAFLAGGFAFTTAISARLSTSLSWVVWVMYIIAIIIIGALRIIEPSEGK